MNIFEQVKESITTKQAAIQYGLNVNQNDMVCCPFHNDRHPSMKVAERYYCFGCDTFFYLFKNVHKAPSFFIKVPEQMLTKKNLSFPSFYDILNV